MGLLEVLQGPARGALNVARKLASLFVSRSGGIIMKRVATSLSALACLCASPAVAQTTDAVVRVVDIGPGLCVVIAVPGGHGMLYDAGPPGGRRCVEAVRELVPGGRLDLVVLSHSDNDHVSMIPAILGERRDRRGNVSPGEYFASTIIHPGDPRGPALVPVRAAIEHQRRRRAVVYNLLEIDSPPANGPPPMPLRPGDSFAVGAGRATFIAGWSNGNLARGPNESSLSGGPMHNNLSIVIRFEYGGHSVLLTGDTVGRMIGNADTTCAYAERIMSGRSASVPIDSDVLVGQHHGADNSTSDCFVRAVTPQYVVFSAGHHFRHPTQRAVRRLTDTTLPRPVALGNIFRTDRGDNEGGNEMVSGGGTTPDVRGDDDVEIRLPRSPTARVTVSYRAP